MRTKTDILNDYTISIKDGFRIISMNQRLIIELLIDIRDILNARLGDK